LSFELFFKDLDSRTVIWKSDYTDCTVFDLLQRIRS